MAEYALADNLMLGNLGHIALCLGLSLRRDFGLGLDGVFVLAATLATSLYFTPDNTDSCFLTILDKFACCKALLITLL